MTALVSLFFITMIPIDYKNYKIFFTLVDNAVQHLWQLSVVLKKCCNASQFVLENKL